MRFTKSHGAGNDFVLIEDLEDRLRPTAAFVAAVCDRHFGIGADGLIRIAPADDGEFFMDYYNASGETAEMCGNGIRCLAKYVGDRRLAQGDGIDVATRSGVKRLELFRADDGRVARVRVDMGAPVFERGAIPLAGDGSALHEPIEVDGVRFDAACVSMGNPHCVLFVDDPESIPLRTLGSAIERHERFPARTNVEFARVLSPREIRLRVWERGSGETLACGTGACATLVAAVERGLAERRAAVHLPGGTLEIEWADDGRVYMTGPAEEVFEGVLAEHFVAMLAEPAETKR